LVHAPMLLAKPSSHWIWAENALNIALTGVAWVVADTLGPGRTLPSDLDRLTPDAVGT